jgi:hypothetical protein
MEVFLGNEDEEEYISPVKRNGLSSTVFKSSSSDNFFKKRPREHKQPRMATLTSNANYTSGPNVSYNKHMNIGS